MDLIPYSFTPIFCYISARVLLYYFVVCKINGVGSVGILITCISVSNQLNNKLSDVYYIYWKFWYTEGGLFMPVVFLNEDDASVTNSVHVNLPLKLYFMK